MVPFKPNLQFQLSYFGWKYCALFYWLSTIKTDVLSKFQIILFNRHEAFYFTIGTFQNYLGLFLFNKELFSHIYCKFLYAYFSRRSYWVIFSLQKPTCALWHGARISLFQHWRTKSESLYTNLNQPNVFGIFKNVVKKLSKSTTYNFLGLSNYLTIYSRHGCA